MRIQMRSQNGIIGIETRNAQVEIDMDQPIPEYEIKEPEISIDSTLPKVEISQEQAFSESGLKGVLELTFENAQIARQLMLGGIQRAVQQGDEIADVSKPNPIPDHAKYNSWDQFKKDYNMVTMPVSGPDIEVVEGENSFNFEEGDVDANVRVTSPLIEYSTGNVEVYMQQYPSLEIWTEGTFF